MEIVIATFFIITISAIFFYSLWNAYTNKNPLAATFAGCALILWLLLSLSQSSKILGHASSDLSIEGYVISDYIDGKTDTLYMWIVEPGSNTPIAIKKPYTEDDAKAKAESERGGAEMYFGKVGNGQDGNPEEIGDGTHRLHALKESKLMGKNPE